MLEAGATNPSPHADRLRVVSLAARIAVAVWAGFWAWFIVAVLIGEARTGQTGGVAPGGIMLAAIVAVSAVACLRPRWGGALLAVAGAAAAVYFRSADAWWLLAGPPIALGVMLVVLQAWRDDRQAGLIPR
ncbi:MAG: hypothetical protein ACKVU4_03505 [Phycisphaerales bacterium]